VSDAERRRPTPGPTRHPLPGPADFRLTRTDRRKLQQRAGSNQLGLLVIALIIAAGVGAIAVIIVRHSGGEPSSAAATPSVAAPPTFGASLPIAPHSSPSGAAVGNAAFTEATAVATVLAAAKTAVQAVDSYDYRRLAANQAAGDALSTGDFRRRYDTSMTGDLATAADRDKTVQRATVEKTAIASLSGPQATVLAFGRLDVTDTDHPAGTVTTITLGVTLQNESGTWRISGMNDLGSNGTFQAEPPGTPGLSAAVTAGAHEVVELLSYSRNNFAADFARALDGLTSTLRTSQAAKQGALEAAMATQKIDYAGAVRSIGIEDASGTSVLMLVCATGYRIDDDGKTAASGGLRFEIGVSYTRGRWLVSQYLPLASS
jgi:hypothetical protein